MSTCRGIYQQIFKSALVLFSNFNNKLLRAIKFGEKTKVKKKKKKLLKVCKKSISFYRSLKSKEIKHLESKCKKYHFMFFMLESGYGSGK